MDKYVSTRTNQPVDFVSGGQFVTEKPWKHIERKIDSYELIIGVNKTVYIDQEGDKYQVQPGDVLLLVPGTKHKGYKTCPAGTSFYWFHFHLPEQVNIFSNKTISKEVLKIRASALSNRQATHDTIFIPFYSKPSKIERINIVANQLLDVSNSNYFNTSAVNYLMTSLLIEISEQMIDDFHHVVSRYATDQRIANIMEWIRIHALSPITVHQIATHFNYNQDYLSRIFKQKTNIHIHEYIHRIKLEKAKDLLTTTQAGIREISHAIGIKDEKYFMRLFKRYELMTPTAFRKAYYRAPLNNQ